MELRHMAKTGLWPPPKGSPEHYGQPRENDRGDLQAAARMFPTPAARDWKSDSSPMTNEELYGTKGHPLPREVGGQLNPRWVEWLMGVPIGWVSLEPLATESYQRWLRGFSGVSE